MNSDKQQCSPVLPPYSFSNGHSENTEQESNDARKQLSRIVEEENKRIQKVAEKENERIMKDLRIKGNNDICPICLEEFPAIQSHEEAKKRGRGMTMVCCNVSHCKNCADKSREHMRSGDMSDAKCYNCREPLHSIIYWAKNLKSNDQRHWILTTVAFYYMHGKRGLKKNTKKAIKLFERAAELGNQKAQSKLACNYLYGISVPKCLSKARYYAEKAAEQGENTAQYLLAELIEDDNNREEELFQLRTLAEFQGLGPNRYSLGMYYTRRYQSIKRGDEGWMRNLLLSVYWFGKSAEVKEEEEYYAKYAKGCRPLTLMSLHLDEAMRVWHPRPNKCYDPLPGYSHIPFCTWALAKRSNTELSNRWNRLCANCGTSREKDTLKACARCKAFYYCCKKCQVEHWKAGHKVDCKVGGHWIEQFFPEIRNGHE